MRVTHMDGGPEREAVRALVSDRAVLAAVAPHWTRDALPSRWSSLVGSWCVDFFAKHDEAPGRAVESLYSAYTASRAAKADPESVRTVEAFLASLGGLYEPPGSSKVQATMVLELMRKHRLRQTFLQALGHLDNDDLSRAETCVQALKEVPTESDRFTDVFQDREAVIAALATADREPLIKLDGDLGKFWGMDLDRGCFVAFIAPPKKAKTWWLLHLAWEAVMQRRRVAFLEIGDMTQDQIMRRFCQRAVARPLRAGKMRWPAALNMNGKTPEVGYDDREWHEPVEWPEVWERFQELQTWHVRSPSGFMRLVVTPNRRMTVRRITQTLDSWAQSGWVADVIVVDYMDLFAPPKGNMPRHEQIDTLWGEVRAMTQQYDALGLSATQSDAEGISAKQLSAGNFSGSKMILAHTTGIAGINATYEEMEQGLQRLNWIVRRDDFSNPSRVVHVAGCLPAGTPAVRSILGVNEQ